MSNQMQEIRQYSMDEAIYGAFNGYMQWYIKLDNGLFRNNHTRADLERSITNRNAEIIATVNKQRAEVEFMEEVIEEMTASGIARHVAINRTNTQVKLLAEARSFGVI